MLGMWLKSREGDAINEISALDLRAIENRFVAMRKRAAGVRQHGLFPD
jgi:hypothetical protein